MPKTLDKRHRTKLTLSQQNEARRLYNVDPYTSQIPRPTISGLARKFNVGYNTMWRILNTQNIRDGRG